MPVPTSTPQEPQPERSGVAFAPTVSQDQLTPRGAASEKECECDYCDCPVCFPGFC